MYYAASDAQYVPLSATVSQQKLLTVARTNGILRVANTQSHNYL